MKTAVLFVAGLLAGSGTMAQQVGYPVTPVPFTATHVDGGFWKQRLDACRDVTIPLAFSKCEETGRYDNFLKAQHPCDTFSVGGFSFDDTDVYKTIEGASYLLQTYPDKKLESYIDSVLHIVAGAQEPDGYLYTARTMNPKHPHPWAGSKRWEKVEELSHEFYNLGHMIEGAVAHYQATGKRNFLDIAIKYADCVCKAIGPDKGQTVRVPGHQIAEMALAKLYLVTGNRKYLDEAKFFLDKRGYTSRKDAYSQAHKPVVQQDEAVGHAVRATYMYSGMADVAALTGDTAYVHAIGRIWDNIVGKKLYLTGGIGATANGEAFGGNYELPNATAYCETCAAIGNVYVNHRLFLFHGDAKYYDVLERSLYNGVLSGISLDGGKFFYPNPLESAGGYERKAWFGCACCPSNLCRFLPSVPGYVYATRGDSLYVNLFMEGVSEIQVGKYKLELRQQTAYPFEGTVRMQLTKGKGDFVMKVRIPGWVRGEVVPSDLYRFADKKKTGYSVKVNGETVDGELENGYLAISRRWKKGDVVELSLDMTPRLVAANEKVADDRGKMAVERGPLVYCAEWPDNENIDLFSVLLPREAQLAVTGEKAPGGACVIAAKAQRLSYDAEGKLCTSDVTLKLIPYYSWANRGQGKMMVWLPVEAGAVHLGPALRVGTNEFLDK
ncbi:glycoside hydrolase family 127 protein [Bacteroides gallinaceum]|uniref:Glycoside hydrolase family 127 protein n=2 Tax=Bacteroidaceae TaxID=815 RepID=A0A948TL64_9BACT|nr:glycoside hydrolase family 127 protein [Candidatus Phocaeicola excrementipullorum]